MKKGISLLRACMTQDMKLFKIRTNDKGISKFVFPILIVIALFIAFSMYASMMIEQFKPYNQEHGVLTIFCLIITFVTVFEGIYKSSSLLFNCKDDQLLLSLPIKRSTVLFVRMFKFYVFELLFNSLFILPAMVVYAIYMNPAWTYYLSSAFALLLLPIVPIIISCIFGFLLTFITTKSNGKNIIQTIITMAILVVVLFASYDMENIFSSLAQNSETINHYVSMYYYPISAYISMVTDFNILTFVIFVLVNVGLLALAVFILGKIYFKINSNIKKVTIKHNSKPYVIKSRSKVSSFIKKELNRFFCTPVFITNAGFGLVLFLIGCFIVCFKFDAISSQLIEKVPSLNMDKIREYIPSVMMCLIAASSFMTSITSSMISLEGKSFNILKSLPIHSSKVVLYKVYAALTIMLPCILVGDLLVIIRFKIDIVSIICLLLGSFLLPFISELIGIITNLKYPKMDATNDTEIVKQSMSSTISVLIGMGLSMVSLSLISTLIYFGLPSLAVLILFLVIFGILALCLWLLLVRTSDKSFNKIQV